jgi:hypothetical protein
MTITKFATASLAAMTFASTSFAGTLTEPVITEVEEAAAGSSASSSSRGIWLPLIALAVVAAVIASNDSDTAVPVSAAQ